MVAENFVFLKGGCVGYGSPRTLTDRGAKPCGDLVAIKPSVMAGVPKVFDTIKKGAFEKINQAPSITQWLFSNALESKKQAIKEGRETPFWNALVFSKAKAITGGNLKLILSGGAPLNSESQAFLRLVLGCITIQGYGLTVCNIYFIVINPLYNSFRKQQQDLVCKVVIMNLLQRELVLL